MFSLELRLSSNLIGQIFRRLISVTLSNIIIVILTKPNKTDVEASLIPVGHGLALRLQFRCKHKFRGLQPQTRPAIFPGQSARSCAARQTFSFLQLYTLYINALGANQNSPFNWNIFYLPERLLQTDESLGLNLESQPPALLEPRVNQVQWGSPSGCNLASAFDL